MKLELHPDFETASELDLTEVGVERYAQHESTRVLMLSYALNDHAVHQWFPHLQPEMPAKLRAIVEDPNVDIIAHNAAFERAIFKYVLGIDIPLERFICTQAMAFSLALPGDLDQLSHDALRLKVGKQKDGKALIRYFCEPQKPTKKRPWTWNTWENSPEKWELFCSYGATDVIAERDAYYKMRNYITDMPEMRRLWALAQRINERGVPVDMEIVRGAQIVVERHKAVMLADMRKLSGLDNPNSTQQVLPWLQERGYPYQNLRKERVSMALEYEADRLTEDCKNFLKMRQLAAKTSVTKLHAIERVEVEGRLYHMFQFRAAGRTGRYGGRVVQMQNLQRPGKEVEKFLAEVRELLREADYEWIARLFSSPLDVVSSLIRGMMSAPPGKKLVVADYSAIELVVLAWLTGCKFWLEVLRKKLDPYKSFGVHFLLKPYEEITKPERNLCKPGALGAGYRLGGGFLSTDHNGDITKTGLWGYAENMHVKMTQAEAARAVEVYRELSPEIVNFWYELEAATLDCIRDQQPRKVGKLLIDIKAPFLRIRLPSGRYLHYCRPKIEKRKVRCGNNEDGTPKFFDATNMTYEGMNQTTKKWMREATHGGKLTENVVQAIALDLLNYGIDQAELEEFTTVLHVHDEIGAEEYEDDDAHGLPALLECITRRPPWGQDIPLNAAGYESPFYKKD